MSAAMPNRRKNLASAAPAAAPRLVLSDAEQTIVGARQDYLDALPIAAAIFSGEEGRDATIAVANEGFRELAGWQPERDGHGIVGNDFLEASGIGLAVESFLLGDEPVREYEGTDGQKVGGRHFIVRIAALKTAPGLGRRCLLTLLDRTAQIETERNLRAEMLRDSLTGLSNRAAFNERVEAALEDPAFQPGSQAVLVLDMNRFSRVNECVGALAGDELLITFARRLVSALRGGDFLARTGGDEFGVLMRLDRGIEEALQAAERIRATLAAPFKLSELEIRIDCAIGVAILSGREQHSEEALRNAQFAKKRSKTSGCVELYEPNQARAARHRFSIETELRHALEQDRLTLAYQPLIDLGTGRLAGFEALARWNHETRGSISPTEFIPVAEESGLIVPLGRWALETAIGTLAGWDLECGRELPFGISVNLSPIQIARDEVAGAVAMALRRHNVSGERLTLELTEGAIIRDPERAALVLEQLKCLRVTVAMDDFGTGYTSLAMLQRLPIDVLKIDRSFVSEMLKDEDSAAIVNAVRSLAESLGLRTTAEGIDTPELHDRLSRLGCSYGQGFHYAEPLAADDALGYWLSLRA
ncbi:MAG: bifunctional diguanylate cyclase/phosphodiesterase [Alphaproteobacteria bacterium]|nr:bifunctional diguanylate cyclase/phosphodiesterase [Alphaproteobacteria bacterium]